jgi:hypothetical protein
LIDGVGHAHGEDGRGMSLRDDIQILRVIRDEVFDDDPNPNALDRAIAILSPLAEVSEEQAATASDEVAMRISDLSWSADMAVTGAIEAKHRATIAALRTFAAALHALRGAK